MDRNTLKDIFGKFEDINKDTFEDRVAILAISERAEELKTGFTNDLYQYANPEKMMWIAGNNVNDSWKKLAHAELIMMGREMPEFFDALIDIYRYKQLLVDDVGMEDTNTKINTVLGIVSELGESARSDGGVFDPADQWEEIIKHAKTITDINEVQSDTLFQLFTATVNMGNYYAKNQNLFVTNPETGMFRTIYFGVDPAKGE